MVMPAIFRLVHRGLLPTEFRLIGYGRTEMTDEARARIEALQRAVAANRNSDANAEVLKR